MSYDVFISYSRQNSTSLANYIYSSLEERGYIVYMDVHRQDGGGLFPEHLKQAILDSTLFICLLGETTLSSSWVLQEIDIAYHANKVMIPVFQETYNAPNPIPTPSVANLLSSQGQHYLDIKGLFFIEATQNLVKIISQTVNTNNRNQLPPHEVLSVRRRLRWIEEHPALTGLIGVLLSILITWLITQQPDIVGSLAVGWLASPTHPISINALVAQTITKQFEETATAYAPTAYAQATETTQQMLDDLATSYWLTQVPVSPTSTQITWLTQEPVSPTSTQITSTPTYTPTSAPTSTLTPAVTPTRTEMESVILLASTFAGRNNGDWEAYSHTFDDTVVRVLVPSGCFSMGNDPDAKYLAGGRYFEGVPTGGRHCFDKPFWLDKNEVTQYQFLKLGGRAVAGTFTRSNEPIFNVTWREAQTFCEKIGGRLPTEIEWEYSARGVESWIYPWGDEWDADKAVWALTNDVGARSVGSRPSGNSWVGASDMVGNISEWTLSAYQSYPYDPNDGREVTAYALNRVIRGGSWKYATSAYLNSASRVSNFEDNVGEGIGFRCAYPLNFQSLTN